MSKKILIADDDAVLVKTIAARLTQNGYAVVTAFDAIQVQSVALNAKPDLVLLDIKMPAGTGRNALESLKASTWTFSIPVIIMTAYPNDDIIKFAQEEGAVDFIKKPFKIEDLLVRIERTLKG